MDNDGPRWLAVALIRIKEGFTNIHWSSTISSWKSDDFRWDCHFWRPPQLSDVSASEGHGQLHISLHFNETHILLPRNQGRGVLKGVPALISSILLHWNPTRKTQFQQMQMHLLKCFVPSPSPAKTLSWWCLIVLHGQGLLKQRHFGWGAQQTSAILDRPISATGGAIHIHWEIILLLLWPLFRVPNRYCQSLESLDGSFLRSLWFLLIKIYHYDFCCFFSKVPRSLWFTQNLFRKQYPNHQINP